MRAKLSTILVLLCAGCAPAGETPTSHEAPITDVSPTVAKRQSIPNCWLYSMATWSEALHNRDANQELDLSEAYWTYWHWYDQLTGGVLDRVEGPVATIDAAGSYSIAAEIAARWGWMLENEFIPEEEGLSRSQRQFVALERVKMELAPGGELFGPESRRPDHALEVLNRVWGLSPGVIASLREVFGAVAERDFRTLPASPVGAIHRANELSVGDGLTLDDVIGEAPVVPPGKNIGDVSRTGPHAWRLARTTRNDDHPADARHTRSIVKGIQRTLHTHRPVQLSWNADDAHVDATGTFRAEVQSPGTSDPYRHLSVITDYEVDDVPGFGTLRAGVEETRAEALRAALDDRATVRFFRIKNPWWGSYPKDGKLIPFAQGTNGYNDLELTYLNGDALDWRRLRAVVLPPEMFGPEPTP